MHVGEAYRTGWQGALDNSSTCINIDCVGVGDGAVYCDARGIVGRASEEPERCDPADCHDSSKEGRINYADIDWLTVVYTTGLLAWPNVHNIAGG